MENHSGFQRDTTSGIIRGSWWFSPIIYRYLARTSQPAPDTEADPRSFNMEDPRMRALWFLAGILALTSTHSLAQSTAQEDPGRLVRETVYNELHDHDRHGYWRYWVQQQGQSGSRIEQQVETADGPVGRLLLQNGQLLDEQLEEVERAKLLSLRNSLSEQASRLQAYHEDEQRVGRVLALLPDAFVYQDAGIENGCRHLRYTPNPKYSAHSIEARIFHQFSGDLWIDTRMKRLRRLEGHLNDNVTFGMGVLGRVNKGSWFRMVRTQVAGNDWKTERLEVHMSGRALMFKTIAHDTSEVRGGFEAVAPAMSLEQGLKVLEQTVAAREAAMATGRAPPVALVLGAICRSRSLKTRAPCEDRHSCNSCIENRRGNRNVRPTCVGR
jgi:hypothetical protein